MATLKPSNVVQVDDRAGNHYWIFTVYHGTSGSANTTVEVDNSCYGASELKADGTRGGNVTVADADSTNDYVKEVTIASSEANGTKTIVARFMGSAAGPSSSKIDA